MPPVDELIEADHRTVDRLMDDLAANWTAQAARDLVAVLSKHSVAEERVVYPEVRQRQVPESLLEHREIASLLGELEDDIDHPRDGLLAELRHAVRRHVADEEGQVLPALRSALDAERRADLGVRFEKEKEAAPSRPHPVAPHTGLAGKVAEKLSAPLDAAKDYLRSERPHG